MRYLLSVLIFFLCVPAFALNKYNGVCSNGAIPAKTNGLNSSNTLQSSYPQCSVLVSIHGAVGVFNISINNPGSGQTNGTYIINGTGGGGSGAQVQITVSGGKITLASVFSQGSGYTSAPSFVVSEGGTPGTLTSVLGPILALIYADNNPSPTPLSNPFTALSSGAYGFYTNPGQYDITMSGGLNGGFPSPYTLADIVITAPGSGGGVAAAAPFQASQYNSNGSLIQGLPRTYISGGSTQACINAAGNGGTCNLPPNYSETLTAPLSISGLNNFSLVCGPGATLLAAGIDAIDVIGGSNIVISGCTVNGQNVSTANGITIVGTNGVTINGGNLIENFGGMGIYASAGWSNLVVQGNTLTGNTSDGVFGTNGTGASVLDNKITGLNSTFHHLVAFHGSDSADAGTVTAVCTVQSIGITSIVGNGTIATLTASGTLPANIAATGVVSITGTADFNPNTTNFYLATVTGTNTLTFPTSVVASDGSGGTASSGTITSLAIGAVGSNYATTGNLQFFNGQITAGTITANIPTGTFTSTGGHLSSVAIINPGYCNSNPVIHANNLDFVSNIDVGGNEFHSGSDFAVEVGSFLGQAANGVNIHDNTDIEDVNVSGYGGYSVDTAINVKFNNNKFTTTQATAPNDACVEMVNVIGGTVTNNTCVGQGMSINKSSFSSVVGNNMTGLYSNQFGIYNGTSDFNENQNNNNSLIGNIINFQPGVIGTGIETQCNTVNGTASNTVVANNTINISSGLSSGNAIVFSNGGLGCILQNSQSIGNIIGPWRHAYSISPTGSGALNLDQSIAVDQGTISNFVPFFSISNQTGIHSIAGAGSAATISNFGSISLIGPSTGGLINLAPSSSFSAELLQTTLDNLIIQSGNASNPRFVFMCGSSETSTTNCPFFNNNALTMSAGNINMPNNGTNGICFSTTGTCTKWNSILSSWLTNAPIESTTNIYLLQPGTGFWNRFTQLGTLAANQQINLPNMQSSTVPSLTASIANCADGFSSTSATWSSTPCLPLYTAAGTLQTGLVHAVNGNGTLTGGTLGITFSGSAVFTSSTSYNCSVSDITSANNIQYTYTSGTSVTFTGTSGDVIRFTCIGN